MQKVYQSFDVGFFDLIIADESHRSIYNVYGDMFHYFDCLQIGLTATPVDFVSRNTFSLFGCEGQLPTANYDLEQAVKEGCRSTVHHPVARWVSLTAPQSCVIRLSCTNRFTQRVMRPST
jgi:type I site-specific restriction endonuclease